MTGVFDALRHTECIVKPPRRRSGFPGGFPGALIGIAIILALGFVALVVF